MKRGGLAFYTNLTPIRENNRGIFGFEQLRTPVAGIFIVVCNYTKGELLIHARNRYWLRPDAHLEGFLAMINFGSGLTARRHVRR